MMTKTIAPKGQRDMDELLRKEDLTVSEAAELLRVSEPTVYRLIESGELEYWRKTAGKGTMIYTKSAVNYMRNVQKRDVKTVSNEAERT